MIVEVIVALLIGLLFLIVGLVIIKNFSQSKETDNHQETVASVSNGAGDLVGNVALQSSNIKTTKTSTSKNKVEIKQVFKHSWIDANLKGPPGQLRDIAINSNDKLIVVSSADGSCTLWNLKSKENGSFRSYKIPIEGDTPNKIAFSPDSKAVLMSLNMANKVRIIKVGRKDDGSPGNFQHAADIGHTSTSDICSVAIASSGFFILIAYKDATLFIYSTKGVLLQKVDTGQNINYQAVISPCGRFVASCGFTPDAKVWEVLHSKSGEFKEVKRAYELKGHNAGIVSMAYSADSSRIVTASKDGTWRLYNVSIDHARGEDPRFMTAGRHPFKDHFMSALSADGLTLAMAHGNELVFYQALTGVQLKQLTGLFVGEVVGLCFDSKSQHLFIGGDRQVFMFNNVPGFQCRIDYWNDMKNRPIHANNKAMRERCDQEIAEAQALLAKYGSETR